MRRSHGIEWKVCRKEPSCPWLGGSVGWSVIQCTKKVAALIPSQGTYLGVGLLPGRGAYGSQLISVFLSHQCSSLCVSFPLSLKIDKRISLGED